MVQAKPLGLRLTTMGGEDRAAIVRGLVSAYLSIRRPESAVVLATSLFYLETVPGSHIRSFSEPRTADGESPNV
jgi:hypothetical protein